MTPPGAALVDLDHRTIPGMRTGFGDPPWATVARMRFNAPLLSLTGMPLPSPPKHRLLAAVLESDAQFADWSARRRREVELTRLLRKHLPRPIADRVRVAEARDGVLELAASAGAIAATLRQRAPDLRLALARDGLEFREVRVRVQVAAIAGSRPVPAPRPWDSRDAAPLFELAERLDDGPLKSVLSRWSRRARGR